MQEQATDAFVAASAHKATILGAGTVGVGWLTLNNVALVIGVITTIAGFVVNLYYKKKADKRAIVLQEARLKDIRDHGDAAE